MKRLLFLLCLLLSPLTFSEDIKDIIKSLKISEGKSDTIVISDVFYAKDYSLTFRPNKFLNIKYDAAKMLLIISAKKNFPKYTLLDFTLGGKEYSIPIESKSEGLKLIEHKFIYTPTSTDKTVSLVGSFNNWNSSANPMTLNGKDYETTLNLEPGSYVYKFIVDGKEVLDPLNPERAPTGFENFNSVIRINNPDQSILFLSVDDHKVKNNNASFSFILSKNGAPVKIKKDKLFVLLNNQKVAAKFIELNNSEVEIELPLSMLKGENMLRAVAVDGQKISNLQTVYLKDGKPAQSASDNSRWEDGIIYSIMVDRFNDGDKSNSIPVKHDSIFPQANYMGGDLEGIISKIEEGYFNSLGVNILWLSPVYDNPATAYREYPKPHRWYSGYHGYWPSNNYQVEEKFGTMDKLRELVSKAHEHNIKVVLDIVAHHVHIENPFYKNHPEWFGKLDLPDGRKNLRLWDEYRLSTWFEPYMPSFDYTQSQQAIDTMTANCIWWLKQSGADGFRHDAVKHVPNLFWRSLTKKLKQEIEIPENKKVYQIGETFGDNELIASYVNNGQLSAQFNFNLSYLAIPIFLEKDKSFQTLNFHMAKTFESFGYNNLMGNIMDSHDKVRYMAYADGKVGAQGVDTREIAWHNPPTVDHPESYDKAKLFYAFMFTVSGLPTIYYGSEFGMTGADDPDNRRMMRFGADLSQNEKKMLGETKKIVNLRNTHSALRYGDFISLSADNFTYAYMRCDFNEKLLIVLNKAEEVKEMNITLPSSLKAKELEDLISGEKVKVIDGKGKFSVSAIGYRVLKVLN